MKLFGLIDNSLSPYKIERSLSRVLRLWAESQAGLQVPMPTTSTVISYNQPPTPIPIASESPASALVPMQEYFPTRQFLLVDDNPINLRILLCFMKKLKQSYQTASNGKEAIMSYKADPGRYACILMDISMPVRDGLEATRQIRAFKRYNDIKPSLVLAITGLASEPTRDEATRSGVDFFVTKPAKIKELEVILTSQGLLS